MKTMTLYHGSGLVVQKPDVSYGKKSNDYGQGFYCTESEELAGEWHAPEKKMAYSTVTGWRQMACGFSG